MTCDPLWKLSADELQAMIDRGELKWTGRKLYRRVPLRGAAPTYADQIKAFDLLAKLTGAYAHAQFSAKADYNNARDAARRLARQYEEVPYYPAEKES